QLLGRVLARARILVVEILDRACGAIALLEQLAAKGVQVDRAHVRASRRRAASARSMPRNSTTLSRLVRPETTESPLNGRSSSVERSRRRASLARPRSGWAVTRTFHASP